MRKGILIGCMAVIMGCMLVGCDARPHYADENNNDQITDFNQINEVLWYDSATKVVYYYPHGRFLCPYISKDGQYCKYEDGQVVPLKKEE